jgi:undecaprenyl diphosphate synthase
MSDTAKNRSALPRHVAIIMDGNGRWARDRGLHRAEGHAEGARSVREVVRTCREHDVPFLTLYAFSLANWSRPKDEVDALMRLLIRFAEREAAELREKQIAVRVIGELEDLPTPTRHAVERLVENTAPPAGESPRMTLSLALSYGGRRDVLDAARAIAVRARAGLVLPEEIDDAMFRSFMTTRELPDVDLLVRTGGEQRLSDFLLFEASYAELYFTNVLWPDFTAAELLRAFDAYANRERRFGRTGEQVRIARMQ